MLSIPLNGVPHAVPWTTPDITVRVVVDGGFWGG